MKIVDIKKSTTQTIPLQKKLIYPYFLLFQLSSIYSTTTTSSTNQTLKTYIPIPLSTITHTPIPLQNSNIAFKRPKKTFKKI